jgi:ribosomal protein L36
MSTLDKIMGVEEASEIWVLSPGYIKNLCAEGKIISRKIGKTWIINKDQPNPKSTEK